MFHRIGRGSLLPIVLLSTTISWARPVVTTAVVDQGTIAVKGSGFGAKKSVGPVKFDEFEEGALGEPLNVRDARWKIYATEGVRFSEEFAHSGARSVGSKITDGESFKSNFFSFDPPSDQMFISYWWRTNRADTLDSTVIKMTRITSSAEAGGGGVYNGTGNTTLGGTYNLAYHGGPYCAYNNGVVGETVLKYFDAPPMNQWVRVDMYKKLSTPGGTDGVMEVDIVGVDHAIDSAAPTRAAGFSFRLNTVLLGTMDGNDRHHDYEIYLDDMYIDTTRARVEIGNARVWSACTRRELQIAQTWSDSSITVGFRRNGFQAGDSQFVFVVDAQGHANAEGKFLGLAEAASVRKLSATGSLPSRLTLAALGGKRLSVSGAGLGDGPVAVRVFSLAGKTTWAGTGIDRGQGFQVLTGETDRDGVLLVRAQGSAGVRMERFVLP